MFPKTIPKLPGTVQPHSISAVASRTASARGELHGPYRCRFWRNHSDRQHKEYVREADLEAVHPACERQTKQLRRHEANV